MFTKNKKNLIIITIFAIIVAAIVGINICTNYSEYCYTEEGYINSSADEIMLNTGITNRNETEQVISGANLSQSSLSIDDFTEVTYIDNVVYFLNNPKHHPNDSSTENYNSEGVCTTVAIQMLMGYHNYYSDRRIIPDSYLSEDYGDLTKYPVTEFQGIAPNQGEEAIGTENNFFSALYDLTVFADVPGIGQNIFSVADAAEKFVEEYSAVPKDEIIISASLFSEQEAKENIDNGNPIVLGFSPIFSSADSFHVVVAYGYAKLDNEFGFLVHYGHGDSKTQVWIPSSWIGFQVSMEVNHVHNYVDSYNNVVRIGMTPTYRELRCSDCGSEILDELFLINDTANELTKVKYNITGDIEIPEKLYGTEIYCIGQSAFESQNALASVSFSNNIETIKSKAFKNCMILETIQLSINNNISKIESNAFENCQNLKGSYYLTTLRHIGEAAFKNCNAITSLRNMNNVEFIGNEAFYNCTNLLNISLPDVTSYIGEKAFGKCINLNISVDGENTEYCAINNIIYDKEINTIFTAGDVSSNLIIPNSVNKISSYAFAGNSNLESLHCNNAIIIGANAFADCENLENVYFYSIYTPQLDTDAFANDTFILYVPYNYQTNYEDVFSEYSPYIDSIDIQVQFKDDGAVLGTQDVLYGSLINYPSIPTKIGYTFEGWYDADGEKYIDADGNGVKLVDKTENFELEAHWTIKSYKIKINGNGFITWLGPDGLSEEECEIEYGTTISSINLIAEFKATEQGYKEGYIFDHFEYNDQTINWTSIPDLGEDGIIIEIVPQWIKETHTIYFNTLTSATIGAITKQYGESISIPTELTNTGYHFVGWYQNSSYAGEEVIWVTMPDLTPKTQNNTYYNAQNNGSVQLYAKWEQISYSIVYNSNGGTGSMASSQHFYHEEKELSACSFTKFGYYFIGWSTTNNNRPVFDNCETVKGLTESSSITLYACWELHSFTIEICYVNGDAMSSSVPANIKSSIEKVITYGSPQTISAPSIEGYSFVKYVLYGCNPRQTPYKEVLGTNNSLTISYEDIYNKIAAKKAKKIYVCYQEDSCVASGSLITLADGTQKAVEELTGEEELLVWNMFTGEFDSAPILFIDSDPERYYEVVNLYFSDGTTTKVISEHAFWDIDLNKYVFLRNDAAQYIGHWFNKQAVDDNGNMINTEVQLTNVVVQHEYTTAWSPVTYGYLCYYVNGMLSMPGATTGLINIFEIDAETMTINQEAYLEDVEEYGLFTYEEFNAICPVPEIIFEAFGGQYLKVSLGKGLITWEELETLISRYAEFWD